MLAAAAEGAAGSRTMLLGISVLTSSTRETLRAVGVEDDVPDQVLRLSHLAVANGIGGIVASPHEIDLLRQSHRDRLFIVTPGVRPLWAAANDQKRMMTPGEAVAKGADALVIGRPITAAPDPVESLRRIEAEIEQEIAEGASDE